MKKRFNNISLYRLVASIGIVIFHVFYYTTPTRIEALELLALQTAGFSTLSGFLFSQKKIEEPITFYRKNIKKISIPAFIVIGMILVLDLALVILLRPTSWSEIFYSTDNARGSFVFQIGNFWYIPYILLCYLITPCLQNFSKKTNWIWIGLALLFEFVSNRLWHVRVQVLPYIIGYFVGKFCFQKYNEFSAKTWLRVLFWLCVLVASWALRLICLSCEGFWVDTVISLLDTGVSVSSLFLILNVFSFLNGEKLPESRFFRYTDKISYFIYLFNLFLFCGITDITKTSLGYFWLCVMSVIIVLGASVLAERFLTWISKKAQKG